MPTLPPDPDALEKWQQMPQNKPSREALPPASGGTPRWLPGGIVILGFLMLIALLIQALAG